MSRSAAARFHAGLPRKASPLRRVQPGDRVVYYSQIASIRRATLARQGPAAGFHRHRHVKGALYQADMGFGFQPIGAMSPGTTPSRSACRAAGRISLHAGKELGYRLRQGLVEISDADMTPSPRRCSKLRQHLIGQQMERLATQRRAHQ